MVKAKPTPHEGILQYKDLSPEGRNGLDQQMADTGKDVRKRTQDRIAAIPATATGKTRVERTTLQHIEPHVSDKTINIDTASDSRVKHFLDATNVAAKNGDAVPAGTAWYFGHGGEINHSADQYGYPHRTAQVASGVMSPLNAPENERAAVGALMHAHNEGKIAYTARLHSQLKKPVKDYPHGLPVDDSHVGRYVSASELHPATLAHLSGTAIRSGVETNIALKDISRGGPKGNIEKAVNVLRGNVHPDQAIDPHTSPKVASYDNSTKNAVPHSDVHHEYVARAAHIQDSLSGRVPKGQGMLDYWGKRQDNTGILSQEGHTAEDTWMNSMTAQQEDKSVGTGRTVVSKTVGSHALSNIKGRTYVDESTGKKKKKPIIGDPTVGTTALQHAFNNRATIVAAEKIGKQAGVDYPVPSVLVQEVAWTQKRRATGKDPEFNGGQRKQPAPPSPVSKQLDGQGKLF